MCPLVKTKADTTLPNQDGLSVFLSSIVLAKEIVSTFLATLSLKLTSSLSNPRLI